MDGVWQAGKVWCCGPAVSNLMMPAMRFKIFRHGAPLPHAVCHFTQGPAARGGAGAAADAGAVHGPLAPGPQPAGTGKLGGLGWRVCGCRQAWGLVLCCWAGGW